MLTILLLFVWRTVASVHGYVKAYAPSNIAIAYLRTRRRLKWSAPVALVLVPTFLYAAHLTTLLVGHGASKWLLVMAAVFFLDACKFGALAILSPFLALKDLRVKVIGAEPNGPQSGT